MADINLIDDNTLADLQNFKNDIEEINQFYHEQSMFKERKVLTEKKDFEFNEPKENKNSSQPSIDLNDSNESKKMNKKEELNTKKKYMIL